MVTVEQKKRECEKFLAWLKRNYPVKHVPIHMIYKNQPQIRKGVNAIMYKYGSAYKFEISTGRELIQVLRSVAHEYEHVRQIEIEGIHMARIKRKQESAAWGFGMYTVVEYGKEVGCSL